MKLSLLSILADFALVRCLAAADSKQVAHLPSTSGTKFTIDGHSKYSASINSYWISFLTNNGDIDLVMNNVAIPNSRSSACGASTTSTPFPAETRSGTSTFLLSGLRSIRLPMGSSALMHYGKERHEVGHPTDFVKNLGIKTLDFGTFHM
ncbi:LOW QUALITY PROTEIN: mannan endo-1,4-beta-mannosidase A [Colletotrichum spaethianum]|uniref:Mannan endo-1,4-beta-mannosidase A n=1 Tax=Colletotrichum spaethianum TaxID=700344 RepID=A0AA37L6Q4_9PEZI|nr:LOW QUALITY PROTEIN: mannan endo-1,4-beta-mannosidase A [Colletotrichum spaethianum]GKT40994.1 LOW QUALITY PROTEIN: mannan endo-1,4-beta-mannosidase A [Colletotrichum spaethianum]